MSVADVCQRCGHAGIWVTSDDVVVDIARQLILPRTTQFSGVA